MQQHTGQHILSQAFYELIKGETLSFHLSQEESTVEINLPAIKDETQQRVEELTNRVVFSDLEVKTYFLPEDKISSIPLRKPPKKSGLIRVVEVAGFDYSACGGTHCLRTGQVGLIKILKQEKIRGNLRFSFVCGFRALKEFENYRRLVQETAKIFSAEEAEVPSCAEKNQAELKSLKKNQRKLEEKLAVLEAKKLLSESGEKIISGLFPDKSPGEIKFLALNLVHQAEVVAILAALAGEYFHLVVAASDKLKVDVRKVIPVLQAAAEFKGGGSPTLIELVSPKKDRQEELCQLAADFFRKKINPG
jgi:alanyl-tRNA synthetase